MIVIHAAATVAGVVKPAFAQEFLPSSTHLEELEKEDQLAQRAEKWQRHSSQW